MKKDSDRRAETVHKHIMLPEHHVPLNIIPVGYPAGDEKPKNKWSPDKVIRIE